jgi:hypothetical protein
MSDNKKGQLKSQESTFNKTVTSPGGFGNLFGSPMRPMTGKNQGITSPKKKSSYHLSNLDQENETVQKLKEKIDHFVKFKDNPH